MASLEEFIESLKERYESLLEVLRERNVPNPEVLVPVVAILLVAALVFFALGGLAPATNTVTVSVRGADGAPIAGARVSLVHADTGTFLGSALTAADGTAQVEKVPSNAPFKVRVQAANYKLGEATLGPGAKTASVTLEPEAAKPQVKRVRVALKDKEGKPIEGASVKILFDDGTQNEVVSNSFGSADLEVSQVPPHAAVLVKKEGFEDALRDFNGPDFERQVTIELTSQKDKGKAKLDAGEVGLLLVRVTTTARAPVKGVVVSLMDAGTGERFRESRTWDDGVASFPEIPLGKKLFLLANDPERRYLESKGPDFEFTRDTEPVVLRLEAATAGNQGELTVVALDPQGAPLNEVEVRLYERRSNRVLFAPLLTDSKGEARVRVANGVTFYATLYKPGLLPGFVDALTAGSLKRVTLVAETPDNTVEALVTVLEGDRPSAGATVVARKSDGLYLGVPPSIAGADGLAKLKVPRKLEGVDYRLVFAASREHATGESDVLSSRPPIETKITLTPAKATLEVTALDVLSDQKLSSVMITAVSGTEVLGSCSTNEKGVCLLEVPPKQLNLVASLAGYLQTAGAPLNPLPASLVKQRLLLYPGALARSAYARFDGLYNARGKVLEVGNGERYRARFFVTMPAGVSEAAFYVRVGKRSTASSDVAGIARFDALGAAPVFSSSTYSPEQDCAADTASDNSSALLKWVEFRFPKGFSGTKEFTLDLQVAKELPAGEGELLLAYRAYALQRGVPLVFPTDTGLVEKLVGKLSAGEALKPRDFCTAVTSSARVPVTSDPLECREEGVCARFLFEDPSTGQRGREGFELTAGQTFNLRFDLLPENELTAVGIKSPNVRVESIEKTRAGFSDSNKLSFQTTEFPSAKASPGAGGEGGAVGVEEQRFSFSAKANEKSSGIASAQAIERSRHARVDFILHTKREDQPTITIPLVVSITGRDRLKLSATPGTVEALSEQRVTVKVLTAINEPVLDANVELYSCRGNPVAEPVSVEGSGEPGKGENGDYTFKVTAQGPGTLCVRARKQGYKTQDESLIKVTSQDFLEVSPESLRLDDANKGQSLKLTVRNLLDSKVRVSGSVQCDGAPASFLQVFPDSAQAKASGDTSFEVRLTRNVTVNALCRVLFTSRVGFDNFAEAEASLSVSVQGPPGLPAGKLIPSTIYIYVDEFSSFQEQYGAVYQGQRVTAAQISGSGGQFGGIQNLVNVNLDPVGGTLTVNAFYDPSVFGGYGQNPYQASQQYSNSYYQGYGYPQTGSPQYFGGGYPTTPNYYQSYGGAGAYGGLNPQGAYGGAYGYGGFQARPGLPGYGMPGFPTRGTLQLTLVDGRQAQVQLIVQSRPQFGAQQAQFQGQPGTVLPTVIRFTVAKRGSAFTGTSEVTHLALPTGQTLPASEFLFSGPVSLESVQYQQGAGQYQGQYRNPTNYYKDISFSLSSAEGAGKVTLTATFSSVPGDNPRSRIKNLQAYAKVALKRNPSEFYLVPLAFDDVVQNDGLYFETKKERINLPAGQETTWELTLKRDGTEDERVSNVGVEFESSDDSASYVRNARTTRQNAGGFADATTDSRGRVRIFVGARAAGAFEVTATTVGEKNEARAVLQVNSGGAAVGQGMTPSGIIVELLQTPAECVLNDPKGCMVTFKFTRAGQPVQGAAEFFLVSSRDKLQFLLGSGQTSDRSGILTLTPDGTAPASLKLLNAGDISLDGVFEVDYYPPGGTTARQAAADSRDSLEGGNAISFQATPTPVRLRVTGAERAGIRTSATIRAVSAAGAAVTLEPLRGGCGEGFRKTEQGAECPISPGGTVFFELRVDKPELLKDSTGRARAIEFRVTGPALFSGCAGGAPACTITRVLPSGNSVFSPFLTVFGGPGTVITVTASVENTPDLARPVTFTLRPSGAAIPGAVANNFDYLMKEIIVERDGRAVENNARVDSGTPVSIKAVLHPVAQELGLKQVRLLAFAVNDPSEIDSFAAARGLLENKLSEVPNLIEASSQVALTSDREVQVSITTAFNGKAKDGRTVLAGTRRIAVLPLLYFEGGQFITAPAFMKDIRLVIAYTSSEVQGAFDATTNYDKGVAVKRIGEGAVDQVYFNPLLSGSVLELKAPAVPGCTYTVAAFADRPDSEVRFKLKSEPLTLSQSGGTLRLQLDDSDSTTRALLDDRQVRMSVQFKSTDEAKCPAFTYDKIQLRYSDFNAAKSAREACGVPREVDDWDIAIPSDKIVDVGGAPRGAVTAERYLCVDMSQSVKGMGFGPSYSFSVLGDLLPGLETREGELVEHANGRVNVNFQARMNRAPVANAYKSVTLDFGQDASSRGLGLGENFRFEGAAVGAASKFARFRIETAPSGTAVVGLARLPSPSRSVTIKPVTFRATKGNDYYFTFNQRRVGMKVTSVTASDVSVVPIVPLTVLSPAPGSTEHTHRYDSSIGKFDPHDSPDVVGLNVRAYPCGDEGIIQLWNAGRPAPPEPSLIGCPNPAQVDQATDGKTTTTGGGGGPLVFAVHFRRTNYDDAPEAKTGNTFAYGGKQFKVEIIDKRVQVSDSEGRSCRFSSSYVGSMDDKVNTPGGDSCSVAGFTFYLYAWATHRGRDGFHDIPIIVDRAGAPVQAAWISNGDRYQLSFDSSKQLYYKESTLSLEDSAKTTLCAFSGVSDITRIPDLTFQLYAPEATCKLQDGTTFYLTGIFYSNPFIGAKAIVPVVHR